MITSTRPKTRPLLPEEITDQASRPDRDQIYQELQGDGSRGDPEDQADTAHGSEERKHQVKIAAEKNAV